MSQTVKLGDQQIDVQDFNGYKFLEATAILGRIMEVVPEVDAAITSYTQEWLAQNGRERVLDRATAVFMYGDSAKDIPDEVWQVSEQKLRLPQSPSGNATAMRVFPMAYGRARRDVENLIALLATPNSKLEADDDAGRVPYDEGGSVFETRRMIVHKTKITQQVGLVIACLQQLVEELREADFPSKVGNLREAAEALQKALAGDAVEPSDASELEKATPVMSPEPSSSTPSSPDIPASPEPTSSIASPTAN
jgi:hypothetical protein